MTELKTDFIFMLDSQDLEKSISEVTPSEILKEALIYEGKPCCSIKGGFQISIDAKVWNSFEGNLMFDDLYVAFNLVKALTAVLNGEKKYGFWMYEESGATMELVDDNRISIMDMAFGNIIFEKEFFSLLDLSSKIIGTSGTLCSFIDEIIINIPKDKKGADLKEHLLSLEYEKLTLNLKNALEIYNESKTKGKDNAY